MKQKDMREFFMPLIVLDAGHGGANPGATYNGRKESEDVLALTLAVGSILEENGVDVYYTRTTDVYESPYQKAQEGNEVGGDYFVSIHRNSSPYPNQYSGVESLVYNRYGADGVQYQCQTGTGGVRESGSKRAAESGGVEQHEYAGGAGGGWIYQYGCRQRTLRQPVR